MKDIKYQTAPLWLTTEYVESFLRKYKKDEGLSITKLDIKPATKKGDNYASVMTRISVDFKLSTKETEHGLYIVKTSHESDPFTASIMSQYDIYNTEMLMYEKVLPKLTELLKEIGDTDKLFADTIYVDYKHSAIIFEDLAVLKFVIPDRLVGMDEAQTMLTLKKLAKMHATAAVLNEREPGILTKLQRGIFNRETSGFAPFFEGVLEACADFAGECASLGSYYKNKLHKLKSHVMEYGTRAFDPRQDDFLTLNHGDMWTNNVMLRYEYCDGSDERSTTGRVIKDILLIDFQFSAWTSPALDLHYFFQTSLPLEFKLHREDELVKYYHGFLSETLRLLHYKGHIPSLHEFTVQMESHRFYAVASSLTCQALLINDKTDEADFNIMMGTGERSHAFHRLLYTNKRIQDNAIALLPYFDRKGLLDVTKNSVVLSSDRIEFDLIKMKETTESVLTWLTKEYFETILREYKKDKGLIVTNLSDSSGTSKGDSFISTLTRFKVEFLESNCKEPRQAFYIAKTNYEGDPVIARFMNDFDVYNREMLMYKQILPQMTALLVEIGDDEKLFADTIHVDFERSAIIFEDLSASDFIVGDRIAGLDESQARLILRKLAKFHATAAVLNERTPKILTNLQGGYLRRSNHAFEPFHEGMVEVCANFADNCEELGHYYKEKLLKLKPYIFEYSVRSFDPKEGHFLTLIHGDVWTTNIMFSFEEHGDNNRTKHVKDARLIDFQFSNWSSPAGDLHYLINTSFENQLRLHRQDELIQYYHEVLSSTLHKLTYGGHIPSLHELCIQLEDRRFYALTSTIVNQPLQISENSDDSDLNSLTEVNERSKNFYKRLYTNKKVQSIIKALLPYFDRKGLLDVSD
ncbi:uncharacterized protein LOC126768097 [Bactrocera neohumeralis]|uniref:uncharacterized protein LOC126768097 n=1 Tax=Bactrocera neohumeralis TaxID=98809 RepID=UPI002165A377|nr:uncharacterized protein LOC126768097 [Bactrocera neohumeralis]